MIPTTGLRRIAWTAILVIGLCLGATSSTKASVTYVFTGQDFTTCYGEFTSSCHSDFISGTITLSTPLIANDSSKQTVTPTSFSFTVNYPGNPVLTKSTDDAIAYFYIDSTNSQGIPTSWAIYIGDTGTSSYTACGVNPNGDGYEIELTSSSPWDCANGDSPSFYQGTDASKGSWVITPEPGTLLLYGTGLLGIAAYLRRGSLVRQA